MMRLFLQTNLDSLKKLVLANTGFDSVSPSDCKTLSVQIFRKTGQQLSETTLKRIYGFAYSKFQPSLFTLDAMARFSGFKDWSDFCEKNVTHKPEIVQTDVSWEALKQNAIRTSGFTLQVLKNRSGIPYRFSINRKCIDHHFEDFLSSELPATIIAAPAGYGKTIGLCHWVENKLTAVAEGTSNDIVLFTSSNALVNVFSGEKNTGEWLLSLLGYRSENDMTALLNESKAQSGNFYLIIDGLDEHTFRGEQFSILFNQVMDIFSLYKFHTNFKVILTMRSSTLINYRHELVDEEAWFTGLMSDMERSMNMPLFNANEIEELCLKINPAARNFNNAEVTSKFNHPLYFQYYYKAHKADFSLNHINHISLYELISEFILNKIYLGPFATEKVLIIRTLAGALDFENGVYEVDKAKINDLIKQCGTAYNDLLSIGFIREVNKSTGACCRVVIEFCTDKFLEYSVAFSMLFSNNNLFDEKLINVINNQLQPAFKVQVLKWCLFYAIKNGQQKSFELIARINLTVQQKSEVIVFMGEMFDQSQVHFGKTESKVQYFNRDYSDGLFDYFFGLEFICNDYIKTLQTLLRFELSSHKKLMIHTGLASIAAVQLDTVRLENHLASIKAFPPEDLQQFPVNPLNCLETIYYWLKYGILKKAALKELTAFYFNPPTQPLVKNNTNDLLFLLALFTLSICRSGIKTRRFLTAMNKVYPNGSQLSGAYDFIMELIKAENHFRMNETAEGSELFTELTQAYENNQNAYTPFIKTFFYLVRLEMTLSKRNNQIKDVMKSLSFLADEAILKIFKLEALTLTLSNSNAALFDEAYIKQLQYEFVRIVRENGLRAENFTGNYIPVTVRG